MASPSLFWGSFVFDSAAIESVNDLKGVAQAQMEAIGLSNATIHQFDVNGSTSDTIVAVTFVAQGAHRWTAIVMAAGVHAHTLRDQLIAKFKAVSFL